MAISSSLYAGISGLSTMGEAMSVLGDNVANVNTAAFKSSRSTFQDVLSQSVSTASGGAQVGRGVTLSTINSLMAQGSFESSSSPTDMAIGGQGFFMLRAAGSAEADMYSRAGEFGSDKQGNLVNPTGYFVQGWAIDSTTGQPQGTIGDITIGKNTPPVATKDVQVITNVDSRKINEASEDRLFANWNGTNAASVNPTDPIDATKYEYTTAVKIYDSKGASHDLTVYFDRTTKDNQWEYLVTCDPTEDQRVLTTDEQVAYNPDIKYNYENHKGAGALLYGTLQFDTSGNIAQIDAYKVPPDGQIDPAKSDNRLLLEAGSSYFTFPSNFTGSTTNQEVAINFGARYEGVTSTQRQVLVSDSGARALGAGGDVSQYITSATQWSQVADANGNSVSQGDVFIFEGYNNGSDAVTRLVYTVDPADDVQSLLTELETTFGCSASIDAKGRLRLSDNVAGESSMVVTRFETASGNGSVPFGGTYQSIEKGYSITTAGISSDGTTAITDDNHALAGLRGKDNPGLVATGDTLVFSGTDVDGVAISPHIFTVGGNDAFSTTEGITTDGSTILTDANLPIEGLRGSDATTVIAGDTFTLSGTDINGVAVTLGNSVYTVGAGDKIQDMLDAISTAYRGTGVKFSLTAGVVTKVDDSAVVSMAELLTDLKGGSGTAIENGDTFTFSGTGIAPATGAGVFTVGNVGSTTVQNLLDFISSTYGGTAVLDSGKIRVMDPSAAGTMDVKVTFNDQNAATASPFGFTEGVLTTLTPSAKVLATGVASLGSDGKILIVDPFNTGKLATIGLAYSSATVVAPPATNIANPFGLVNGSGATALTGDSGSGGSKISDLLTFLDKIYGGKKGEVHSVLDQDGKIRLVDLAQSKGLAVSVQYDKGANATSANPFGLVSGAVPLPATPTFLQKTSVEGQVNITTSKKMVQSPGRALSTNTGDTAQIMATTQWSSVYDDNNDPTKNGGLPRGVSNGDAFTFKGTKRDGTNVTSTFTVAYTKTDGNPGTVQDLLTQLEAAFDCQASIDSVGRLVLTDRVADTVAIPSSLEISSVAYDTNAKSQDIFGPTNTTFDSVRADVSSEDGSQQGDVLTTNFAAEALSTTQYANSSTTIFQDQDGFSSGFLQSVSTDVEGVITGHYSNGQVLKKAQVALANFSNLAGLSKRGGNVFTETSESGAPVTGAPGTNGLGSIAPNALEQSNVDLGVEFVKLITVQRGFQANSKIITTTDDMLNELINIKR